MELRDHLTQIRESIRTGQFVNEASVSQGIVLRILQAMGWPIFDSRVVAPEYAVQGRRVDYALCHPPNKPLIFVEVKQVGQSEGADRQLFEYAFHLGVPMAVLTDGQEWHFYLPGEQGLYQERRVYKLDLIERDIEECTSRLKKYLDYEASCTGKALEAARKDYQDIAKVRQISSAMPVAWAKLLEEPDELLVELIADKVESLCGYKPDPDTVARFLSNVAVSKVQAQSTKLPTESKLVSPPLRHTQKQITLRAETKNSQSYGFTFDGYEHRSHSAREIMIQIFEELAKRDPTFLERFASRKHGTRRRFVARTQAELYPGRPDIAESNSYRLSSGWWIGTNYGRKYMTRIIKMACEVSGLKYGRDLVVDLNL